jgi:hypothetical protein
MSSHQGLRATGDLFLLSTLAVFAWATATPTFAQIPPRPNGTQQVSPRPVSLPRQATLPIKSSMLLCGIIDCGPTQVISQPGPIITQVSPASVIEPGGNVLVRGTDFNAKNGSYGMVVLIVGDLRALSHREFVLQNTQWSNKAAFGQIPSDISGLVDQVARLQIRRTDGLNSDPVNVQFIAARVGTFLPVTDVQVQCSFAGDEDQCDAIADFSPKWSVKDFDGLWGFHRVFLGQASGTDQFSFVLKNGWVFSSVSPLEFETNNCPLHGALSPIPLPVGATQVTLNVNWSLSTCEIAYAKIVFITGPRGVPWK